MNEIGSQEQLADRAVGGAHRDHWPLAEVKRARVSSNSDAKAAASIIRRAEAARSITGDRQTADHLHWCSEKALFDGGRRGRTWLEFS